MGVRTLPDYVVSIWYDPTPHIRSHKTCVWTKAGYLWRLYEPVDASYKDGRDCKGAEQPYKHWIPSTFLYMKLHTMRTDSYEQEEDC